LQRWAEEGSLPAYGGSPHWRPVCWQLKAGHQLLTVAVNMSIEKRSELWDMDMAWPAYINDVSGRAIVANRKKVK